TKYIVSQAQRIRAGIKKSDEPLPVGVMYQTDLTLAIRENHISAPVARIPKVMSAEDFVLMSREADYEHWMSVEDCLKGGGIHSSSIKIPEKVQVLALPEKESSSEEQVLSDDDVLPEIPILPQASPQEKQTEKPMPIQPVSIQKQGLRSKTQKEEDDLV